MVSPVQLLPRQRRRPRVGIVGGIGLLLLSAGLILAAVAFGGRHGQASNAGAHVPATGLTPLIDPGGILAPMRPVVVPAPPGQPAQPSTTYQLTVSGVPHFYRLHAATGLSATASRPLILVLPGWRRTAQQSERDYGFDALTGVDVAYLDGQGSSWNAGTCCGYAVAHQLDDLTTLHQVVDAIALSQPVDRTRVVLAGFSNGGMLAFRAGCTQAPELAGLIVVSASVQISGCTPTAPISLVVGHGVKDLTVPIAGVAYSSALGGPVTSQAASLRPFLAADACASSSVSALGDFAVARFRSCKQGVTLDDYTDGSVAHEWLPAVPGAGSFAVTAWALLAPAHSTIPFAP